jgi:antitoxin component of MazEF toxin-antitoxin module
MEATVQKWGNSLEIRIPNLIVRELLLKNKLSEMLDNISDQNIHQEVDWGKPVGKEIL